MADRNLYKTRGRIIERCLNAIYAFSFDKTGKYATFGDYLTSIGVTEAQFLQGLPPSLQITGISSATANSSNLLAFAQALYAYYENQFYAFQNPSATKSADGGRSDLFMADAAAGGDLGKTLGNITKQVNAATAGDKNRFWKTAGLRGGHFSADGAIESTASKYEGKLIHVLPTDPVYLVSQGKRFLMSGNDVDDFLNIPTGAALASYVTIVPASDFNAIQDGGNYGGATVDHVKTQQRIDRFLGDGFDKTAAYITLAQGMPGAYQGQQLRGDFGDSASQTTKNNKYAIYDAIVNLTGYNPTPGQNRDGTVQRWIDQGNIIFTPAAGGYKDDNSIHFPNADSAAQGMFNLAVGGSQGGGALSPGDTYDKYFYPSPAVVKTYGNNLAYFIRCAPDNLNCALDKDLTKIGKAVEAAALDALKALNKINPAFVVIRNAYLSMLDLNLVGMDNAMTMIRNDSNQTHWNNYRNMWSLFGGDDQSLAHAIDNGKGNKPFPNFLMSKWFSATGTTTAPTTISPNDPAKAGKIVSIAGTALGGIAVALGTAPDPATKVALGYVTAGGAVLVPTGVIMAAFANSKGVPTAAPTAPAGTKTIPGTNPPLPSTGDPATDAALAKLQLTTNASASPVAAIENFFSQYQYYIIGGVVVLILIGIMFSSSKKSNS